MNEEQPTYEELKSAKKLDEYLADLERDRASRVPSDMKHDEEFLKNLAIARDFALLHEESEPRPEFVKALEQKLVRRGVKEEDRMLPHARALRRILPFSLAVASLAVVVLAVLSIGTWSTPQASVSTGVRFFDPSSNTQEKSKSAMQRTTEKIAQNVESLKQKITDTSPEPSAPPAPTNDEPSPTNTGAPVASPEVKIASVPAQILDELNGIDDDFLFSESDVTDDAFGQEVALAGFFTDAESIDF